MLRKISSLSLSQDFRQPRICREYPSSPPSLYQRSHFHRSSHLQVHSPLHRSTHFFDIDLFRFDDTDIVRLMIDREQPDFQSHHHAVLNRDRADRHNCQPVICKDIFTEKYTVCTVDLKWRREEIAVLHLTAKQLVFKCHNSFSVSRIG